MTFAKMLRKKINFHAKIPMTFIMGFCFMQGILACGFAVFSMFFGSGNLVCPLILGTSFSHDVMAVLLGFVVTAVGLPLMGLLGLVRHNGKVEQFFKPLGRIVGRGIPLLLIGLLGPFGVVPRNITIAHGSMHIAAPSVSLLLFSLCFCAALTLFIWHRDRVIPWIAFVMTPLKLGGLTCLIVAGLYFMPQLEMQNAFSSHHFFSGLQEGYQTMDLIASYFFSATIYMYLKQHSEHQLMRRAVGASLLGAGLLALVYVGFLVLAAQSTHILAEHPSERFLSILAQAVFGEWGAVFTGCVVTISCLTTATILSALFAEKLPFPKRWMQVATTIALNFGFSLLGFEGIRMCLGAVLTWLYPFLVVFTAWRLLCPGLFYSK